jgi:hypothetical protein
MRPIRPIGLMAIVLGSLGFASLSMADRIIMRSNSMIKGKAIVDEAHPDQYLVFGEKGKTPLVIKKDRVARIEPEPSILDDYAIRRKGLSKPPAGVPAAQLEYEVGLWCEEHKLFDLASVHFDASLKRDATYGPAHRKLGHVEHDGKWLTPAELRLAQGYVLYRGKWITPDEKARKDAEAAQVVEQQSWLRKLGQLRQALLSDSEAQSHSAESQLLGIREPAAISAVVRIFANDENPALRKMGVRVLGAIAGPEASAAIVDRLLAEADDDTRQRTMEQLTRLKEPNIIPRLVQGLQSKSLATINRAAWGLANLNAVTTVPKLIPALTASEVQVVWVPSGNGQGQNYGGMLPGVGGGAGFGVNNRSIPIMTGPVVGPGVVAYGATSLPSTAFNGSGVNLNGGNQGATPKYVEVTHRNVEVLAALVKLTGQNFEYDIEAWKRWLSTAYQPEPKPAKRVHQP